MAWGQTTRRWLLGAAAALGLGGRASGERTANDGARDDGAATGGADDEAHHLLLTGGSAADPVRYAFRVDGRVAQTGSAGPTSFADERVSVDPDDRISRGESWVEGGVAGGVDAYQITGEITRFGAEVTAETTDRVHVYFDGERVQPADLSGAASTAVEFLDCASAHVPADLDEGGTGEVSVSTKGPMGLDTHVLGLPDEGGVYRPDVNAPAVALDSMSYGGGDRTYAVNPYAGPWCLEYLLVVAGGSADAPARYEFSTRATIRKTDDVDGAPVSRATVDDSDEVSSDGSGATASGGVAGGADAYYLRGELTSFRLDGDAAVYVAGDRVQASELGSG